jgi:plastocyanin
MLNQFWRIAVLVAIVSLGMLSATDSSRAAGTTQAISGSSTETGAVKNQVIIDNFTFGPTKLTIPVGAKVTWVNHDDVPHVVKSTGTEKGFTSHALDTDDQFSYVFTAPGTYNYFCAIHPMMTGQIIVK